MAIIKKYKSIIEKIDNPIPDIYIVSLKCIDKQYKYLPGQFLHLALDPYDPSSAWPESRCFSMQSNENDETIKITYAVKGSFTKRMANELRLGNETWLKLPYGELFSKDHNKESTVFIAGGTGVTPYLSLFTSDKFIDYKNPVLYLGIRDENFNLYKEELEKALTINRSFKINIVNQKDDGMLNIDKIFNENGKDCIFFVSGPPVMIKNFKNFLLSKGVGSDNVRTDEWE